MARPIYVLTTVSCPSATNITVSHNSSLMGDGHGQLLYQDPSSKIVLIKLELQPKFSDFKYSENLGGDALVAEPNTRIELFGIYDEGNTTQWVYYLQTNESNIVEYKLTEDKNSTVYNTTVVYSG